MKHKITLAECLNMHMTGNVFLGWSWVQIMKWKLQGGGHEDGRRPLRQIIRGTKKGERGELMNATVYFWELYHIHKWTMRSAWSYYWSEEDPVAIEWVSKPGATHLYSKTAKKTSIQKQTNVKATVWLSLFLHQQYRVNWATDTDWALAGIGDTVIVR